MAGPIFASFVLAILALILFAWIAQEVDRGDSDSFDFKVRQIVHSTASPWLTGSMEAFTRLGSWDVIVFGIAVCEIAFVRIKRWRAAVWLLVAMAGASILDTALKTAFHRTRPSVFFGSLPKSYSFPSGHALISFCFYGIVAALVTARIHNRVARVAIWVAAALIVLVIGVSEYIWACTIRRRRRGLLCSSVLDRCAGLRRPFLAADAHETSAARRLNQRRRGAA